MKKKILIVDDDTHALFILENMLSQSGYDVVKAEGGKDAILIAKSQHPDLIMLDVKMPDIDGDMTTDILRNDPTTRNIPIIYQTSLVKESEIEDGYVTGSKVGNMNFVAKPYKKDTLLQIVERTIEKSV